MTVALDIAGGIAVVATAMVVSRRQPVHALLYLVLSLLAVAVMFFILGAYLVAALEVIIYAGAIIVLFLFVVMLLNVTSRGVAQERSWLAPPAFIGPLVLAAIIAVEMMLLLGHGYLAPPQRAQSPADVGILLFGPYVIAVEVASLLLLAGVVAALHLGQRPRESTSVDSNVTPHRERQGAA